ncbi:MAG: hypothetical protein HGA67_02695 [Candidatus Yonathbacteria bacterium]|nr:hypothetical protein [Candidatus Yonathbacteria bacterium]
MKKEVKKPVHYYLVFNETTKDSKGTIIIFNTDLVLLLDDGKDFISPKFAEIAARYQWEKLDKIKREYTLTIIRGDPYLGMIDEAEKPSKLKKIRRLSGKQFVKPKFAKPQGFA